MPNWAEGTIRIKGKFQNVINFLSNELQAVVKKDHGTVPVKVTKKYISDSKDERAITEYIFSVPDKLNEIYEQHLYFKDSSRQFLFTDSVSMDTYFDDDKEHVFVFDDFNGAWHVEGDHFNELAKKYDVDIRIWVWECGLQWWSKDTYYRDGEEDHEDFGTEDPDVWLWEAANPFKGG